MKRFWKILSLVMVAALLLPMVLACTDPEVPVTDTTTTAAPDDGDDGTTTTAEPDGGTTTAAPDDGTTTTAEPDDGNDGTTTIAEPDDGNDGTTTTAEPDGGNDGTTTTVAPDGGDDDPDADTTTTAAPDAGSTTTAAPDDVRPDPAPVVTYKNKDGSTAATQTVAQGAALPAPPANVRGVINMGATGWKDSEGKLYFWNYFATSDSVTGWVDANGEPVDLTVTGDVTLTAWSDVVDLATVTGNTKATNGTFQLQNLHQNVYDLGAWDLSLYSAVKVTYGRDKSVANGGVLKLLAANDASATPVATTTLIQTPVSWMAGATTVTVDLSAVNGLYEHLYLTLQSGASTGCYRIEFIYKGDAPSVTHTVTYLNRDGSTLATQSVAQGATVPAPTAVWQGISNRTSTCWKDAEGNLYFWNNHVASDGVTGWTNAAGEAVAFKVRGNVTLTASSQVVDFENIPGAANRTDGTPQLANIQSNVYDLGAWDLSKYAAVKITYGRDARVTGGTLYLHAKDDGSAPPVASAAMIQVSANYVTGPATVTMDLSAANRAYQHLYLTVSGSNQSTGCYRIEFIEWDKGEEPPVIEDPTREPIITDQILHQTVTEGYEKFQHYHLSSALGEGYVTLTATEDIAWISPAVSIPTASVLAIKYRTHYSQAASICLQAGEHMDEHYFYWVGDGEWHLLTLELSDAVAQEEVINGLHLTLAGQATVEVDIQYIAFFDTEDAAKTYDTAAGSPTATSDIQTMPDFKVSGVFGSHMVLQRNQPIRVWGFSNSEGSTVTGTFAGETVTAQVTPEGTWMLTFSAQNANKVGQTMTISDDRNHTTTLEDILIGDVWLIGGQSNAEMSISRSEIPADLVFDEDDPIRLFRQNQHYAATSGAALLRPQKDILLPTWGWNTANESAAKAFSAIGYYFAKEVAKQTDVPQGMIMIAADGGRLQEFYPAWVAHELGYTKGAIVCEGGYYNTLIAPFEGLSFKGMLFFQGEAESLAENTALTYEERFAGLIATQRERFGFDFPLYFVQLSSYTGFPYHHVVRMQQFEASKSIPNATMVVSMDKGAPLDYSDWAHSPYKYEIGCRLALAALCKEYGIGEASHALSPMPTAAAVSEDGTKITLTFANVGDGLTAYGLTPEASIGQSVAGFSVTTEAGTVQTTARILSANTVEIDVPDGLTPVSVDYAYFIGITTDNASLYNSEGLPAAAFSLTLPTAADN